MNGVWAPIDELKPEEWDETVRINLRGTFLTVHHAVPLMKKAGGSIAITSSINGTRTFTTAGASAYATTKAGQLAFGQMLAIELAQHRIRVNVICPGSIGTEISDNTKQRHTERTKAAGGLRRCKGAADKGGTRYGRGSCRSRGVSRLRPVEAYFGHADLDRRGAVTGGVTIRSGG